MIVEAEGFIIDPAVSTSKKAFPPVIEETVSLWISAVIVLSKVSTVVEYSVVKLLTVIEFATMVEKFANLTFVKSFPFAWIVEIAGSFDQSAIDEI